MDAVGAMIAGKRNAMAAYGRADDIGALVGNQGAVGAPAEIYGDQTYGGAPNESNVPPQAVYGGATYGATAAVAENPTYEVIEGFGDAEAIANIRTAPPCPPVPTKRFAPPPTPSNIWGPARSTKGDFSYTNPAATVGIVKVGDWQQMGPKTVKLPREGLEVDPVPSNQPRMVHDHFEVEVAGDQLTVRRVDEGHVDEGWFYHYEFRWFEKTNSNVAGGERPIKQPPSCCFRWVCPMCAVYVRACCAGKRTMVAYDDYRTHSHERIGDCIHFAAVARTALRAAAVVFIDANPAATHSTVVGLQVISRGLQLNRSLNDLHRLLYTVLHSVFVGTGDHLSLSSWRERARARAGSAHRPRFFFSTTIYESVDCEPL